MLWEFRAWNLISKCALAQFRSRPQSVVSQGLSLSPVLFSCSNTGPESYCVLCWGNLYILIPVIFIMDHDNLNLNTKCSTYQCIYDQRTRVDTCDWYEDVMCEFALVSDILSQQSHWMYRASDDYGFYLFIWKGSKRHWKIKEGSGRHCTIAELAQYNVYQGFHSLLWWQYSGEAAIYF